MTVIHFETESSNEALQENIRNIVNTLGRSLAPPARVIVPTPIQIQQNDAADAIEDLVDDASDSEAPSAHLPSKPRRIKRTRPASAETLDTNLEEGDISFKDFHDQKQITTHSKRYLVIGAWFKEHRGENEITGNHIYTCYRWLNMNTMADITQPLRHMKQQGWFNTGSKPGTYAINRIGLNQVNDMATKTE